MCEIDMEECTLGDSHKILYDNIVKRHKGSNRLHCLRLFFYILDIGSLVFGVSVHFANSAYLGLGLTIGIHLLSALIIALAYDHNQIEIDDGNKKFEKKKWIVMRTLSKYLGVASLFQIIVNWKSHGDLHRDIRTQQKLRKEISREEVSTAVLREKRLLVNAHFDTIHAYFKTIPQCLLQIYMALDMNLPLKFCGITDVFRFCTMAFGIGVPAFKSASYTHQLSGYLKLLQIQDNLEFERVVENFEPPKAHVKWVSFLANLVIIGARVYALSFLMHCCKYWIVPFLTVLIVLILNMIWIRVNTEFRPTYENPPRGTLTRHSETIDRFMNVFSSHTFVPSITATILHQIIFGLTFTSIFFGTQFLQDQSEPHQNVTVVYNIYCNVSTVSSIRHRYGRATPEVLNHVTVPEKVTMFEETFTYNGCTTLLAISFAVALGYTFYAKKFKVKTEPFPFQLSFKSWYLFLCRNYEKMTEAEAIRILLLGVMKSKDLEAINYRVPLDVNELIEFMKVLRERSFPPDAAASEEFSPVLNQCNHPHLLKLEQRLTQIPECQPFIDYFIKHFDLCMSRMTSYRIAQTTNILCDDRLSTIFFKNYKDCTFCIPSR